MSFRDAIFYGGLVLPLLGVSGSASAQDGTLKAKSGEVIDLLPVFRQVNCRGTLLETPVVEVFQAPPELTLAIKDQMVEVPEQRCAAKIKGAMVVVTVGQVRQPSEGRLIFRVKYKGEYRESQTGHAFDFALSP
jgi:hypothetical protein